MIGSDAPLFDHARFLLADAVAAFDGTTEGSVLRDLLVSVDGPLRVAIAGRVKTGKSTLLNALVGEHLAATDAGECTRVVTHYEHGVASRAWAHPVDGALARQVGFNRSNGSTMIDLDSMRTEDVRRLVVEVPNVQLTSMTLIDTPGIGSLSPEASERARAAIEAGSEDGADAVIYLMRHLHPSDVDFLEAFRDHRFRDVASTSCIGILSRPDEIGGGRTDSLDIARRIADRWQPDTPVAELFPVSGLLALAGLTLREHQYAALESVARQGVAVAEDLLSSVDRFSVDDVVAVGSTHLAPAEQRRALLDALGMTGVRLAVTLIQLGAVRDASGLAAELVARSGLPHLQTRLQEQFGERRHVLRTRRALRTLDWAARRRPGTAADRILAGIDRIVAGAHEFAELQLLDELRRGTIDVDDRASVEALLGACGTSIHARLRVPPDATAEEVRTVLRDQLAKWQWQVESPLSTSAERRRATVLRRTCEGLFGSAVGLPQGS